MTLELLVFITSVLFGILLYWRESHSNKIYRFFNKMLYSKKLQMKPEDRTGFLYRQTFIWRLVFLTVLFLFLLVIWRFLIPIDIATISVFASSIIGTLLGTYIAGLIQKAQKNTASEEIKEIEGEIVNENPTPQIPPQPLQNDVPPAEEKSARDRLKEKGLL